MKVAEKLAELATWSIQEYDDAGGHISEHLESVSTVIKQLSLEDKKNISIFNSREIAEEMIHKALRNQMIARRIERWLNHPEYQKQTRMILGYPTNEVLGYAYHIKADYPNAVFSEECRVLCLIILRNPLNPKDFILYSAYPKENNQFMTM